MKISGLPLSAAALVVLLAACSSAPAGGSATPDEASQVPTASAASTASPEASATEAGEPPPTTEADALLAVELTDVRTGDVASIGELADGETLLLQPMAVWCTTCRAQQHEVEAAHGSASFQSVSLDVDLSESPEDLAAYADREGWDWTFAMADADLYRDLQDRFGTAVTNPPSAPLIVVEPDGTVRALEFGQGVRSADQLLAELDLD